MAEAQITEARVEAMLTGRGGGWGVGKVINYTVSCFCKVNANALRDGSRVGREGLTQLPTNPSTHYVSDSVVATLHRQAILDSVASAILSKE